MKTLTRYIGREVLAAILLIFGRAADAVRVLRPDPRAGRRRQGSYTLTSALLFVALQLPSRMYELFPVAALIGTLFAMAQLVANSEYTVMRASGASLAQVTWALMRVGIPLAVATFLAGEFVAPPAERLAQQVRAPSPRRRDAHRCAAVPVGVLVQAGPTFANIRSVLADMTLLGVRIYEFDRDLRLKTVRVAESGVFAGDGQWQLTNVSTTRTLRSMARRVEPSPTQWTWDTVLRPSLLTVYQVAPEQLELDTLYDNIRVLGATQKTSRFEIAFWNKVFYPAAVVVMMMLALPFAYFQRRCGRRRLPHLRGHDARARLLPAGPALLQPRRAQRLAAAVLGDAFPLGVFVVVASTMLWWLERR